MVDRDAVTDSEDVPTVATLFEELAALESETEDPALRDQLEELKGLAGDVQEGGVFGQVVYGFDRHDVAEAVLGSLLFGIPMAVESGTNEAGAFLAGHGIAFAVSILGTVALVYGILYVAEIQDVRVSNPLFGSVPRRLVGVLGVAAVMATLLLTLWGRVDWVTAPWLATSTVTVAVVPMAFGAALGDILPGS